MVLLLILNVHFINKMGYSPVPQSLEKPVLQNVGVFSI